MSNPFTRFLRSMRPNAERRDIEAFVAAWDVVEAIVVDVNKRGSATDAERTAYATARSEILEDYKARWAARFAPHWMQTLEGGKATPTDPFPRIVAPLTADGFVQNWGAMQALAAARETLNRYILTLND